jgi:hypothetical protein
MSSNLNSTAANTIHFRLLLAQSLLALLCLVGPPHVRAATNLVKATAVIYEFDNTTYSSARAVCIAAIKRIQGTESKRYKVLSGELEDNPGASAVGIKCTFEDTDSNGSRDSSMLGHSGLTCPDNSRPFSYSDKTCECESDKVVRSGACVDASQTPNPILETPKT